MKFLLISYNDSDGVGQVVLNLNKSLNKKGHKSEMIVLSKTNSNNNYLFEIPRSSIKRIFYHILEFLKKRYLDLFSFGNTTINYKSIKKYIDRSEVIIIYSLHKFLDFQILSKIMEQNKIVYFRPLDMELATGGCHVNYLYETGAECEKYLSGCNKCPKLNYLNFFNISNSIFKKKKSFMEKYKPKIILENKFTKNFYQKSPITKYATNSFIYLNTRDSRKTYIEKAEARKLFNFENKDKILLFGTYNLNAPHKGGRLIEEILKLFVNLSKKNGKFLNNEKIKIVTFGRQQGIQINVPDIKWVHLQEIHNDKKLNALYRSADIFLSPSTGCNGPATIRESIVNDLPVIAFDHGEASEIISNNVNGYLVPNFDKHIFAESIFNLLFNKNFQDKNNLQQSLKLRYSSETETNKIIAQSFKDIKLKK